MIVSLESAIQTLKSGDVAAIPTETVYGLAGLVRNEDSLKKIFAVKGRPLFDPLIVHIADISEIPLLVEEWSPSAQALAQAFWPGPLTMVVKKKPALSKLITAGLPHVALRMPQHPVALEILRATGPLAAPSANRFGKTSPTTAAHVEAEFQGKVPVVDGGASSIGIESTVIKIEESASAIDVLILRPGHITPAQLEEKLNPLGKTLTVEFATSKDAPGQLDNHYQPDRPLVIGDHGISWDSKLHDTICEHLKLPVETSPTQWEFQEQAPELVARTLYSDMRLQTAGTAEGSYVYLKLPRSYYQSAWTAIRDRVEKASHLKVKLVDNQPSVFVKNLSRGLHGQ